MRHLSTTSPWTPRAESGSSLGERATDSPTGEEASSEERPLERAEPVHTASAEPGNLARCVDSSERLSIRVEDAPLQVGLEPAEGLACHDVQADRDERPRRSIEEPVRSGHPGQAVAKVSARSVNGHGLRVLAEGVPERAIACKDLRLHLRVIEERCIRFCIHSVDETGESRVDDEVGAALSERVDPPLPWKCREGQETPDVLPVSAGFCSDPDKRSSRSMILRVRMNQPVLVARRQDVLERPQGVKTWIEIGAGSRLPTASIQREDGPATMRMACPGQMGSKFSTPSA